MVEEGQALWAKIQAERTHDAESQKVSEPDEAVPVDESTSVMPLMPDGEPAVTQEEYVAALVQIAADLTVENTTLRQIAATALEQAAEVGQLRSLLGLDEPIVDARDELLVAIDELRFEVAELRERVDAPRRRWWRFGR